MKRILSRRETVWPTRAEIDLLHAALDEDPSSSRAAWDRWRLASGGVPDAPARRLLPLVEWNLRRGSAAALDAPGFVEHGALAARSLAESAAPVLDALRAVGAPVLALKGLALAHAAYPHPALRAMSDIDLLVQPSDFERARAALEDLGWTIAEPEPALRLRHLHGAAFRRQDAPEIDLHTRALAESASPDADVRLFGRAAPIDVAGTAAKTLSPADHLLVVCVHGLRWSTAPPIHWVADAAMVLRRFPAIDWETLLDEARRRDLEATLGLALQFLSQEFRMPVPPRVLGRLSESDSKVRQRELAIRMTRPTLAGGLFLHWRQLAQERGELTLLARLRRFPSHLREMWALDHAWEVPAAAIRKSVERLARRR